MNKRPLNVLLLIIVLVVGINAVLYHYGMLDSFLANVTKSSRPQAEEGPLVRREIHKLILPLNSSREMTESAVDELLNETDLSAEKSFVSNQSVKKADAVAKENASIQTSTIEDSVASTTATAEKFVNADKVADSPKLAEDNEKSQMKTVVGKQSSGPGSVGVLITKSSADRLSVQVPMSAASGKITWLNLDSPRRLVVDVRGKWENDGKSLYRLKNGPVEKIIAGLHADKIRFVFYIKKKSVPAKVAPEVSRTSSGITIGLSL